MTRKQADEILQILKQKSDSNVAFPKFLHSLPGKYYFLPNDSGIRTRIPGVYAATDGFTTPAFEWLIRKVPKDKVEKVLGVIKRVTKDQESNDQ